MDHVYRIVIRSSNTQIKLQIVETINNNDKPMCSANSSELRQFGVNIGLTNVPCAYLTAILLACKFKHKYNLINISKLPFELMLDCGKKLNTSNFVTAVLDGLRLQNMLPYVEIEQSKMNMYKGELIYNYMINIRNKSIDEYKRQFSRYISLNITPNDIFDIYSNAEKYIINKYLN